jgi:hypothetical protein
MWSIFGTKTPPPLSLDQIKKIAKILIVDDNKPDELMAHFRKEGWAVNHLPDIDAMQNKQLMKTHIVCLDIMGVGKLLGLNNGLELAGEIKKIYPEKKIILYSTLAQHDIFNECVDVVDRRLKKESSLLPFSSAVQELSKIALNWEDALIHSYNKISPIIGNSTTYDQFKKAVSKSTKNGEINADALEKSLKIGKGVVDIVVPLIKFAISVGR